MEKLITNIQAITENLMIDLTKYTGGNKAAGVRARKATVELTKLYKQFRKESIAIAK